MSSSTRAFFAVSLVALVGAASLHLLVLAGYGPAWSPLVHVMLFGWITGMIFAVSYHTMPVFAARDFPYPALIWWHLATFTTGVTVSTVALLLGGRGGIAAGLLLQLVAALLFVANTMLLFLRGLQRAHRHPVSPIAGQERVDRLGVQATRVAALCLPLALLLLLLLRLGWVGGGWLLAAEHLAAVGWIMLMIVGVAYHVLPRFSGRSLRGVGWARLQLHCHFVALTVMIPALGLGWTPLFAIGSVLVALAVGLFAWTIWPTVRPIQPYPPPSLPPN
ncbi:MAG: hypothetical protein M3220_18885 [Chloroflexota bacterium]|nr:hypothetical protein [Chloroflexota bacterium]